MSHIDDLFRDGLSGRKADIPNTNDLWARINAAKQQPLPEGEALDATFRNKLGERTAAVPANMWSRIAAARARRPWVRWSLGAAALLLLLLVAGLSYNRTGKPTPPVNVGPVTAEVPSPTVVQATTGTTDNTAATRAEDLEVGVANTPAPSQYAGESRRNTLVGVQENQSLNTDRPLPISEGQATLPFSANSTTPSTSSAPPARNIAAASAVPLLSGADAQLELPVNALPEVTVAPAATVFRSSGLNGLKTELLFGIAYARQEFGLQDPNAVGLRDLRESSEFPEFGYQITLRSTYQLNERFRLLAGLTYAEIRNELEYERFSGGQTTLVTTNNNIRMLEAPVLLGYSVQGRRVNVTVNAGPLVNLTTSVRGRFLDPDFGIPQNLATAGNYRRNVGIGFMASLSTAYQIGKKRPVTILLEPYFKTYPTAFTVKSAPVREKYWVAGLQLGIRKSLR